MKLNFKYKGETALLITALIWGSGFVASDLALGALTPYQVMALRFGVAAVLTALLFHRQARSLDRRSLRYGLVLGTLLYFSFLVQTIGLVYTTPAKNAFLTAVNVIIVPFIGLLIYRRKVDRYGAAGACLATLGVGLISLNRDLSVNIGDLFTLACAVGFAFQIFYTGEFLKRGADAIRLTIVQLATAAGLALIVAALTGALQLGQVKGGTGLPASLLATLYLGVFSTTVCYLLQTTAQKWTTETRTAVILCTESVFGALFSAALLHERLTARILTGSALVFAAIIVAETRLQWKKKAPAALPVADRAADTDC